MESITLEKQSQTSDGWTKPLTRPQIQALTGICQGSISKLTHMLKKKGFLEALPNPGGRGVGTRYRVTESCEKLLKESSVSTKSQKERGGPKLIPLDGRIPWRSLLPYFEELLKWEGRGTGLTPRNLQLALKRHLANPNAERFENLQESLESVTFICEEIRQLKHCSSPGGYLGKALEGGLVAPPSVGFKSLRKRAESKIDKPQKMKAPQDAPAPTAAQRGAVLRRVQRMPNLHLNDVLGGGNHFLPTAVKRKMAMGLLLRGEVSDFATPVSFRST